MDAAEQLVCYSIDDIYRLPEGKRAELIDGELYMMAAPSMRHQWISGRLYKKIADYIELKNGACRPFAAPFAVFLHADDTVYLEPDISVVCDKEKLTDKGCNGAPDWIIEIVSPSSRTMDYYQKLMQYSTAGVREYWIADYEKNLVIVYCFAHGTVENYTFSDKVRVGIYEDFVIDFSEIDLK